MAGRRSKGRQKKKKEFVSVSTLEPTATQASNSGISLHIESVCRQATLDQDLNDISCIPSSSKESDFEMHLLQEGVVYQICATVATNKVGFELMPSCEELEQAVALAFRKTFERNKNKISK